MSKFSLGHGKRGLLTFALLLLISTIDATTKVKLPPLLGPHKVGTKRLSLTDPHRTDPWVPELNRTIYLQLFYPLSTAHKLSPATWLPPNASAFTDVSAELEPGTVSKVNTRIYSNGTAIFPLESDCEIPVLFYSPGFFSISASTTSVLSSLASYGYTIIGVDHTFESFPIERTENGELVPPLAKITDIQKAVSARVDDVEFIAKQLTFNKLCKWLPGSKGCEKSERVKKRKVLNLGIFGTSLGGNTAALARREKDTLFKAAALLDSPLFNATDPSPFRGPLLYLSASNSCCTELLNLTWPDIKGEKFVFEINGTSHSSFSDFVTVKPQLPDWNFGEEDLPGIDIGDVGTIDDEVMNEIVVTYLKAFWDRYLLGVKDDGLLNGEDDGRFPEVSVLDLD